MTIPSTYVPVSLWYCPECWGIEVTTPCVGVITHQHASRVTLTHEGHWQALDTLPPGIQAFYTFPLTAGGPTPAPEEDAR